MYKCLSVGRVCWLASCTWEIHQRAYIGHSVGNGKTFGVQTLICRVCGLRIPPGWVGAQEVFALYMMHRYWLRWIVNTHNMHTSPTSSDVAFVARTTHSKCFEFRGPKTQRIPRIAVLTLGNGVKCGVKAHGLPSIHAHTMTSFTFCI